MLDFHTQGLAVSIDAVKPSQHAVEKLHVLAAGAQVFLGQRNAFFFALLDHDEHVSEDLFHLVLLCDGGGLAPECVRGHAEILDEIVFLHIRGAEGLIEIVENTDGGFRHGVFLLFVLFLPDGGGSENIVAQTRKKIKGDCENDEKDLTNVQCI